MAGTARISSPVGALEATSDGAAITGLTFTSHQTEQPATSTLTDPVLSQLQQQLTEYFAGERTVFDLPIASQGTPFQRQVWKQLTSVAFGQTCSYSAVASAIGRPTSVRAVASAIGRNPIAIVVPCHRVIGSDGRLTGYAGGLDRKAALLAHERG